jgi:homocysteine S-methyltransferase
MDVILHFTCRDRNILGLQADLLSVYALGVANVLALTGDPPSVGDYPFATGVYEVNSRGLVEIISKLNSGVDYLGNKLSSSTGFWIGVAASPWSEDAEGELKRLNEKIRSGANFVVTQPVFDVDVFSRFFRKADLGSVPIFAGLLPLVSSRQAEFLHHEVPGITIPESIRQSMKSAGEAESRSVGVAIAARLMEELSQVASGVCIMAPLRRYDVVIEMMGKAKFSRDRRSFS